MTTLNSPVDIDLSLTGNATVTESFWTRLLSRIGALIGRSWEYLNEDMGPVDHNDVHFTGGCCC